MGQDNSFFDLENDYGFEEKNYIELAQQIEDSLPTLEKIKLNKKLVVYGSTFQPVKVIKGGEQTSEFYFDQNGFGESKIFLVKRGGENYCMTKGNLDYIITADGDTLKEENESFRLKELAIAFDAKTVVHEMENRDTENRLSKKKRKVLKHINKEVERIEKMALTKDYLAEEVQESEFFVQPEETTSFVDVYVDENQIKRKSVYEEDYNADCGVGDTRTKVVTYFNEQEEMIKTVEVTSETWLIDYTLGDERYQGHVMQKTTYHTVEDDMDLTFEIPLPIFPE